MTKFFEVVFLKYQCGFRKDYSAQHCLSEFLKKIFRNLKILKISMPKKITPKSQVKIKPQFPQYPFLNYF